MGNEDDNGGEQGLFRAAMLGVTPMEQDTLAHKNLKTIPVRPKESKPGTEEFLPDSYQGKLQPEGNRGISNSDLRRLKRGQIEPKSFLDLHGTRGDRVIDRLSKHCSEAMHHGVRCLVIIHGKGQHSDSGTSIVKSETFRFLNSHPAVIAWCPALAREGGSGATYVYLRKRKARLKNAIRG